MEEHQAPMEHKNDPFNDEFLKVYFFLVIADAVAALVSYVLSGGPGAAMESQQSNVVMITSVIFGILGLTVMVLSVIAFIKFKKKGYSFKFLAIPILSIASPILYTIIGAVVSVVAFSKIASEIDPKTGPSAEQIRAMMPDSLIFISYTGLAVELFILCFAVYLLVGMYNEKNKAV